MSYNQTDDKEDINGTGGVSENNENASQQEEPAEETASSGTSDSNYLVCQGALCRCDKGASPDKLMVLSQQKYFINDSEGAEKLVANTLDIGNPFEKKTFGTCSMKPPSSNACVPAITKWNDPYENVVLGNGGKILLDDSSATCSLGGKITILMSGQDPPPMGDQQIENGNIEMAPLVNPLVDEESLAVLAGHTTEDDEEDQEGASVKTITTEGGKKAFAKHESIKFSVSKYFRNDVTDEQKQHINWLVYDEDDKLIQKHIDAGDSFETIFLKNGSYKIEAYGKEAGGDQAATFRITVKDPELASMSRNSGDCIRPGEQAIFSLKSDVGSIEDVGTVSWLVYEMDETNKYTIERNDLLQGGNYEKTATFPEEGKFEIMATCGAKTMKKKLSVGGNWVTGIKGDINTMKINTDTAKFNVTGYRINPALDSEKEAVQWKVYNASFNEENSYAGSGDTFEFANVDKEGIYYVEALMSTSEIKKVKDGGTSSCIKKIEVTVPVVVKAEWMDGEGNRKLRSGYKGEISWIHAELKSYHHNYVDIQVYCGGKLINTIKNCKTNNKSIIHQEFKMEDKYREKDDKTNRKIRFKIIGRQEPIKNSDTLFPKDGMIVESEEKVTDAYFMYEGKRIRGRPVAYGVKVQGVVETVNLVGVEMEVDVYQTQKLLNIDAIAGDGKVLSENHTVDNEGRIKFNFTLEEKWYRNWHILGRYFYIGVEKGGWKSWFRRETIFKNVLIAFKEGDKLEKGVMPVVVEKGEGTEKKKKEGCPNCDKDITLAEIQAICTISDTSKISGALSFLNEHRSFFGLDTCTRKAHFLAQLAQESGFSSLEEGFNYAAAALKTTFGNFSTPTGEQKADEWGRPEGDDTPVSDENEVKIANWAYAKGSKATELGNDSVTDDDWDNEDHDGYKYRGRGFIQITGKSNYKKMSERFNSWIASGDDTIANVAWHETGEEDLKNSEEGMAVSLIYWIENNLVTRSDMGVGEDALRAITYKINSKLEGYSKRKEYLENAVDSLKVKDCPDFKRRDGQRGTVVVVSGEGDHVVSVAGRDNVVYKTVVYRSMTLDKYMELKDKDELPPPDYTTFLTRDAHQTIKDNQPIIHSEERYGSNNECPPGEEYYLNSKTDAMGNSYLMYLSDSETTSNIDSGPNGHRDGIAIHQYDRKFSIGCLTLASSTDTSPVYQLLDQIPDLFVHHQLEDTDYPIERRYVRIILEERDVVESTWDNGNPKWTGFISND